jgi:hypothetical protein
MAVETGEIEDRDVATGVVVGVKTADMEGRSEYEVCFAVESRRRDGVDTDMRQ